MESQTVFPAQPSSKPNSTSVGVKWGLIAGLVSCVVTTVNFMFILKSSYVAFLIMSLLSFVVTLVLSGMGAAEQRRAQGGYITFKEAFRVVFITVLIATIIGTIYGLVYVKAIDPGSVDRMKESTLTFMERMGTPQDAIDDTAANFDKQNMGSMSFGRVMLGAAQSLIIYSLLGLLVALIVRRRHPENLPPQ